MGKILKRFDKKNVTVQMSRQRCKHGGGWEYPIWVSIHDPKDKRYGWEQSPRIFVEKEIADKHFKEIVNDMKDDLVFALQLHAPQIDHHFKGK